jgi:hypothetical protein
MSVVSVLCCQLEVNVSGRTLIQRNPTGRGVSEYDRVSSIMRMRWHTRGCCVMEKIEGEETCVRSFCVETSGNETDWNKLAYLGE